MEFKELTSKIRNFGKDSASYWGNALAGEVGEACNLIKKHERDKLDISDSLPKELADIFIYLELTAQYFNIDLEEEVIKKLDIISKRKDYDSFNR